MGKIASFFLFQNSPRMNDCLPQTMQSFPYMREENLICLTQIVESRFPLHKRFPPSAAAASAKRGIRTFPAFLWHIFRNLHKFFCGRALYQIFKTFRNRSKLPLIHTIEIAGINTSVPFHDKIAVAASAHTAADTPPSSVQDLRTCVHRWFLHA